MKHHARFKDKQWPLCLGQREQEEQSKKHDPSDAQARSPPAMVRIWAFVLW
jgi:hypothetical protein